MSGERLVRIRSLWAPRTTDGAVGAFRAGWAVPLGGVITWPVTVVSATSAIYLVPTTVDGATTPQAGRLDYDDDGLARLAVGFAYPGLFGGEATGDIRLNAAEGVFLGTCGGPATARILMPANGTRINLEANTVKVSGQGFRVAVVGVEWIWPTADAAGPLVSDGAGNLTFDATGRTIESSGTLVPGTTYPVGGKKAKFARTWTTLSLQGVSGSGSVTLTKNGSAVTGSPFAFTASEAEVSISVAMAVGDRVEATTTAAVYLAMSGVRT